jgi:spore coat polysaccharide biosynthesis protein SpsF
MNRRLVAALACRVGGSRLYGKPLQNLDAEKGITILDHLVALFRTHDVIREIVLGISEGEENSGFVGVAQRWRIPHIWGDVKDVLQRLIDCGRAAQATDVFRITPECPFIQTGVLEESWERHVSNGNDVTVTDGVPEGTHFEIYKLSALEESHDRGSPDERSELCNLYIRRRLDQFRIEIIDVPASWKRMDLRLTVDYPEDLVVCRRVYAALKAHAPRISLDQIIPFLDSHPELRAMVAPYVVEKRIWSQPAPPRKTANAHA